MKNTIRVERARLEISQRELSHLVHVSRQTIHAIEKGRKIPSVELAMKISKVFKLAVESVFLLENKKRAIKKNKK